MGCSKDKVDSLREDEGLVVLEDSSTSSPDESDIEDPVSDMSEALISECA